MGFKSSAFAIAQTTRFKRKMHELNRKNGIMKSQAMTPPATPFNNTSFLIQLQQHRQQSRQQRRASFFDQYGSMESYMTNINSYATSTNSRPQLHLPHLPPSTFSQTTEDSPREIFDSQPCASAQGSSCSGESSVSIIRLHAECEGDGVDRPGHHSH